MKTASHRIQKCFGRAGCGAGGKGRATGRRRSWRGNAVLEFAIGFGLLLTIFAGVWQFGYTFYIYNALESAVRDGARYGAVADYDGGALNGATFKTKVANMAVYGNPIPPVGATPVVLGLSTSNIAVIPTVDANGVPHRVTVEIDPVSGFQIPSGVGGVFAAFTLIGKPACSFEYQGRYTVP